MRHELSYSVGMNTQTTLTGGTVQTLYCYRRTDAGAVEHWTKPVYIPNAEMKEAYAAWIGKDAGVFFYTLKGDVRGVSRKPRNVAHWNE